MGSNPFMGSEFFLSIVVSKRRHYVPVVIYLFISIKPAFAQTCHYLQIIIIIIITTIIIIIIITVVLVSLIVNIFIIQILILSDLEILLLTAAHCNINDFKLLLLLLL